MIINSLYKYVLIFLFTLFIQTPIYASCSKSYTLGFFNGVWNTQDQATTGRDALRILIGDTYNNEPIHYESFYNHTGSSVGATALQDIAETFIQRAAEIDASGELGKRFEYFWEFIGSSEPTFIDKIKGIFSNAIALFDSLYTAVNTKLVAIISYFTSNPPTETDYAAHNAKLDALAADGQKLMLVAHSQGNLFMNHAYDHILPIVTKARVSAAHIAPASPTLHGDYVLANIDLVINLLRIQGASSVQPNNLDINASRVDVSGHTLIGTYLDPTRDGRGRVKEMIVKEMDGLKCNGVCIDSCILNFYTADKYRTSDGLGTIVYSDWIPWDGWSYSYNSFHILDYMGTNHPVRMKIPIAYHMQCDIYKAVHAYDTQGVAVYHLGDIISSQDLIVPNSVSRIADYPIISLEFSDVGIRSGFSLVPTVASLIDFNGFKSPNVKAIYGGFQANGIYAETNVLGQKVFVPAQLVCKDSL